LFGWLGVFLTYLFLIDVQDVSMGFDGVVEAGVVIDIMINLFFAMGILFSVCLCYSTLSNI
ncbi:hypothetical protein AAHH80_39200, partial [Burkholderia pseudomallei]